MSQDKPVLPCPFCGYEAELRKQYSALEGEPKHYVRCSNGKCGARYVPGGFPIDEWNQRASGPASGSPDGPVAQSGLQRLPVTEEIAGSNPAGIANLSLRLEQRARDRVKIALFADPPLKVEETDEWIAAQTLRALEAESEKRKQDWIREANNCAERMIENKALQRQLDQHKEWLRGCLDVLEDIGPADWVAQIRKEAFGTTSPSP